ncbi:hypothetical protein J1605_012438 [Eschrichtius robustus]|uniref:Uncharacterized protein n=1 Tax=Eschrichtius robustus TaxID=9764 RepID=A0AB34GMC2_ESCRO|nr:hypothetical protein J1605_012438 [Eschrichtius robustus]
MPVVENRCHAGKVASHRKPTCAGATAHTDTTGPGLDAQGTINESPHTAMKSSPHSPHLEKTCKEASIKLYYRASLVAQWLRICLPMQGTRVRALVREDPTCRGATRPMSHNY